MLVCYIQSLWNGQLLVDVFNIDQTEKEFHVVPMSQGPVPEKILSQEMGLSPLLCHLQVGIEVSDPSFPCIRSV